MDERFHVHVQERGIVVQFENGKLQLATGEVQGVGGAAGAHHVHDFVAGAFFREEHHVQPHILEKQLVFGRQVCLVVYTGDHPLGPQFFGQKRADNVHALVHAGIYGYEKIGACAAGFPQRADIGGLALDSGYVCLGGQFADSAGIGVDDRDVIAFHGEHLGQVGSRTAGSFDDNFHVSVLFILQR